MVYGSTSIWFHIMINLTMDFLTYLPKGVLELCTIFFGDLHHSNDSSKINKKNNFGLKWITRNIAI